MKWILVWLFVLCGVGADGQTNLPPSHLFSLPALQLRGMPPEFEQRTDDHTLPKSTSEPNTFGQELTGLDTPAITNSASPVNLTNEVFLTSSGFTPAGAALYERLLQQGYFSREQSRGESPFDHFVEAVFVPEVTHLGKVDVSCSILTAIKRQNPLCLINPIFFQLTW